MMLTYKENCKRPKSPSRNTNTIFNSKSNYNHIYDKYFHTKKLFDYQQ